MSGWTTMNPATQEIVVLNSVNQTTVVFNASDADAPAATNSTVNATQLLPPEGRFCDEWEGSQYALFQLANLSFMAAFLVPHNFTLSILVMRSVLTFGFGLTTLWAALDVCAPDIFGWNMTFAATNCVHAIYLACKHFPPRIDMQLYDLFIKVFFPLKVDKKNFKQLISGAEIRTLNQDEHYSMEAITPADERLSILLVGKMRVTCENVLLHYIHPYEFIDSPEWEACPVDSDKLSQVTITAMEKCDYLCWPRRHLQQTLKNNHFLSFLLDNLIGKDITHKLYSLNEFHRMDRKKSGQGEQGEWWRQQIPRSLSVDAVHTGTKGRVRSLLWRTHDRRDSNFPPDSVGSSPARTSRHSAHFSDPGPFRSPLRKVLLTGGTAHHHSSYPAENTVTSNISGSSKSSGYQDTEAHVTGHVAFETPV